MAAERHRFSHRPAGDSGEADPRVAAALSAWASGTGGEHDALTALAAARLLVPVVAVATGRDETGGDSESEMALPTLIGNDGRPAIIAFTGTETLARWRPDARPVAAGAPRVWQAAVAEGCAVVIDVAGPVPFAVEGARLAALAAGEPPPPPHLDPDIRAAVESAIAAEPSLTGVTLSPGRDGTDLAVTLHCASLGAGPGGAPAAAAQRAAPFIAGQLAARLRRGIELSVAGAR